MCVYVWTVDRTTGGLWGVEGRQAAVVSVNLCPLPTPAQDSSLTGITNMTPGHATLATMPELSSSISHRLKNQEPLNTDYYITSRPIANMVWPQWTMVSGRVFLGRRKRETTCSMLNAVCRHVKESVWTGFDTYGTGLQPAVFGDINSLSVREVDLHFVTEKRGIQQRKGWVMERRIRECGGCWDRGEGIIFEVACCLRVYGPRSTCRAWDCKVSVKVRWNTAIGETCYTCESCLFTPRIFLKRELDGWKKFRCVCLKCDEHSENDRSAYHSSGCTLLQLTSVLKLILRLGSGIFVVEAVILPKNLLHVIH